MLWWVPAHSPPQMHPARRGQGVRQAGQGRERVPGTRRVAGETPGGGRPGGPEPRRADLFDEDSLTKAADGCSVIIHAATAIPTKVRTGPRDWATNDRIRPHFSTRLFTIVTCGLFPTHGTCSLRTSRFSCKIFLAKTQRSKDAKTQDSSCVVSLRLGSFASLRETLVHFP